MKRLIFWMLLLFLMLSLAVQAAQTVPYKNPQLPVEQRVEDLLKRMTLLEKIRQMDMYKGQEVAPEQQVRLDVLRSVITTAGIGSVHDLYATDPQLVNAIQRFAVEHTRLGIPILFIEEALHGYGGPGATTFPAPIGLASTWNRDLLYQVGRAIATEARAHGVHFVLSPVLGLAREPRWGRVEETYGEDPFLSAEMGVNMILGLQGDTLASDCSVVSEPKHFGAHSQPEAGSNTAPVFVGEREMRTSFLSVFQKAIQKAGALGVMAAYHELDGIPCVSNPWLLKQVLREEWGFKGFVLSDMNAIGLLVTAHHTAGSAKEALIAAIANGTDMQFYDFDHTTFQNILLQAVQSGELSEQDIDRAVRGILYVKFVLGLFENPYVDPHLAAERLHTVQHQQLALQAARESIVLLKNEKHILPLSPQIKRLLVVGPLANVSAIGGYSPRGARAVTLLEALKKRFAGKMEIHFEPGVMPLNGLTNIDAKFLHPAKGEGPGLWAEFFAEPEPGAHPVCSRMETHLSPYWGREAPCNGLPADSFSVRWSGTLVPPYSGVYEIGLVTDDRGRVFLNNELLIDNWQPFKVNVMLFKRVHLKAGKAYPITIEYGELSDFAGMRLKWRLLKPDPQELKKLHQRINTLALQCDAIIAALGENDTEVGEGKDKANLNLAEQQQALIEQLNTLQKPLGVVLLNGRPLTVRWLKRYVPAIVEAWFPGEFGGVAITDVLFGNFNPCGKLPVTFPKAVGQVPFYYNHKPSSTHSYVDLDGQPLFPFGHGLSYTQFTYSHLSIKPLQISPDETLTVSCTVTNSGNVAGSEVVQLYVNDVVSSVTTPVRSLQGFEKVYLKPGQSKTVVFNLKKENLALWNRDMEFVVEPGIFEVMVGRSSADIRLRGQFSVK